MTTFQYHPDIIARFPNTVGGIIIAQNVTNTATSQELRERYHEEQQAVLRHIGDSPLSQIPSLVAWRNTFRGFNVDPTQYRSAAEALLRRLTKKGDIPSINTLVDIGNLVSIRYALPVAIFDTQKIQGPLTVHFADGTERYIILGQDEVEHPNVGEVVFTDETGRVHARRWCWRQSEQSAVQLDTTQILITVEAHHQAGKHDVQSALNDLLALLKSNVGSTFTYTVLDTTHISTESEVLHEVH
jgi:DNA/RNA-binding domain of Phe-tRNA-synthetase-like protein